MGILRLFAPIPVALAGVASAADDTVPRGWFSSGWPAALADAACDDDMACVARLRACGPEAADCTDGVSYCSLTRAGVHVYETACQTDRQGHDIVAHVPSRTIVRMRFGDDPRLDGAAATISEDDCLYRADTQETFCARAITQPHTLRAWAEEERQ
ncbi:MAG: hypothetical protein NXH74_04560 [Rhodobacteraceae bacterium]|jgi:hypothetical protein|nr:hypothetical protein [Paracoccaceae bacterium]